MDEDKNEITDVDPQDLASHRIHAVLSYFGILVLVPIFAAKDSQYAQYHANQGLVLFLAEFVCGIVTSLLTKLFGGGIFSFIFSLASLAFLAFTIMGIINAVKGEKKPLPLIGGIQLLPY